MTQDRTDSPAPEPKPAQDAPKRAATSSARNREEASEGRAKMVRGIMERNRAHGEK